MNFKEIIGIALDILYRTEYTLIERKVHERTIAARLMLHLQHILPEWHVDVEFNREDEQNPKHDSGGKLIVPDIIIHRRGPHGPNLAVILMKGFWNNESRDDDKNAAIKIKKKHKYEFAFFIELKEKSYEVIEL